STRLPSVSSTSKSCGLHSAATSGQSMETVPMLTVRMLSERERMRMISQLTWSPLTSSTMSSRSRASAGEASRRSTGSPPARGNSSAHARPQVDEHLIVGVETEGSRTGVLDLEDGVDRDGYGEDEEQRVQPAGQLAAAEVEAGEQRAEQRHQRQQHVDGAR